MTYGHIGWVVPHEAYPPGYHCNPSDPLPFISVASQKNFIALYHMGMYGDANLLDWFKDAWDRAGIGKLDMGKSCIRFKKIDKIPLKLIGALAAKVTPEQWVQTYTNSLNSRK